MHRSKKINIGDVNPHLLCVLCGGYFVDATTIIECLHSFCKTCIIRYLETNKNCPSCEVLIHKTKPRLNIRSDKTLQDIVYKLVPGLYKNEMKRRRDYYSQYDNKDKPSCPSEERGDEMSERYIFTENEKISLALEYWMDGVPDGPQYNTVQTQDAKGQETKEEKTKKTDVRYLQCPGALTVGHLKKFIRLKFELPQRCRIDMYYKKELLSTCYTLLDIACIYSWKRLEPLMLHYCIYENIIKRRKVEKTPTTIQTSSTETQTKMDTEEAESLKKDNTNKAVKEHKFLTPVATKDWHPQGTKAATSLPNKPITSDQNNDANLSSPKPPELTDVPVEQSVPKSTMIKPGPRPNPHRKPCYQPTAIAPKVPTNPFPNPVINKVLDDSSRPISGNQTQQQKQQLPEQQQAVEPIQKSAVHHTIRTLVNNKAILDQNKMSANAKISKVSTPQQNKSVNPPRMSVSACVLPKSNYISTKNSVNDITVSSKNAISSITENSTSMGNGNTRHFPNSTQMAPLSVPSVSKTHCGQTHPVIPIRQSHKPIGTDLTQSNKLESPNNSNGPLKVNMNDLSSVPAGAVIRSVKSSGYSLSNRCVSNSAKNSRPTASVETIVSKQKDKNEPVNKLNGNDVNTNTKVNGNVNNSSLPKANNNSSPSTPKLNINQRPAPNSSPKAPTPKLNGLPRPSTPKGNSNPRPSTPKINGNSRPSTPKINCNSRPSTPKANGNSRPSTPKLNGISRPSTPKVSGNSRPSTPNTNVSDMRGFKPIAPKPILPKEDVLKSPCMEMRLPSYPLIPVVDKRPVTAIDSSSSDICEEIRQRKLARMDEPLNLVKRDQDRKSTSPVNGSASPQVSPRNNHQMIVGNVGI